MELVVLKMPPDRIALVADAIERDIENNPNMPRNQELKEVHTWLRYRFTRWVNTHETTPQE